jgi:hypothetical protein
MKWNVGTYKLMKSLRPIDMYEILTRGVCSDYTEEIKRQIVSVKGEWYLNNWWRDEIKLDVLDLYLSDTGFKLFTTKKEAERLEEIFKSWGLFRNVWSKWYGGYDVYTVGFQYDCEAFNVLYTEWLRDKKLNEIGI